MSYPFSIASVSAPANAVPAPSIVINPYQGTVSSGSQRAPQTREQRQAAQDKTERLLALDGTFSQIFLRMAVGSAIAHHEEFKTHATLRRRTSFLKVKAIMGSGGFDLYVKGKVVGTGGYKGEVRGGLSLNREEKIAITSSPLATIKQLNYALREVKIVHELNPDGSQEGIIQFYNDVLYDSKRGNGKKKQRVIMPLGENVLETPLTYTEKLQYAISAMKGLMAVHRKYIHGDIKIDNIPLFRRQVGGVTTIQAKIIDFAGAWNYKTHESGVIPLGISTTIFLPPEGWYYLAGITEKGVEGPPVIPGPKLDTFGMGLVLLELFYDLPLPWDVPIYRAHELAQSMGKELKKLFLKEFIEQRAIPEINSLRLQLAASTNDPIKRLAARMLAIDPADRPDDAEVLKGLQEAM